MARLDPFLRRFRDGARALGLPGKRVLLAVSGGADSVAMLLAASESAEALGCSFVVGTVDHGWRAESADDVRFVAQLGRSLGLEVMSRRVAPAKQTEAAARAARYRALKEMAAEAGCGLIATAHTADDQAETVLMRLGRGAGTRGARGIAAKRGVVVRPLLEARRGEARAFLERRGVVPREDPTNASRQFLRNRVRQDVLPALEAALGKHAVASIARSASLLAEEDRWLESLARRRFRSLATVEAGGVRFEIQPLMKVKPALRARVLRLAMRTLGLPPTAAGVRRMQRALGNDAPSEGSLGRGARFICRYGVLTMERAAATPASSSFEVRLEGGTQTVGGLEITVVRGALEGDDVLVLPPGVALPLTLRSRRPGDRFRPANGLGGKKLKAFLIDEKIPRERRDLLPLLVDANGQVLWVVGVRKAEVGPSGSPVGGQVSVRIRSLEPCAGMNRPLEETYGRTRQKAGSDAKKQRHSGRLQPPK